MTHGPVVPRGAAVRHIGRNRIALTATALISALALFAACRDQNPTAPGARKARGASRDVAPPANVEFFIHSAPIAWQLFMGDVTVASLHTGHKVVMVHTTAGDGGQESPVLWQTRESGALASVDAVVGAGTWACAAQPINGHSLQRCAKSNAVVYFMRMPDGNSIDGLGYGKGSLSILRDQGRPTNAIDGSTSYGSWADYVATIHALVLAEAAGQAPNAIELHSPDYDRAINPSDHPDALATADAIQSAIQGTGWTGAWYVGQHTSALAANLSASAIASKQQVWTAYDNAMTTGGFKSDLNDPDMNKWIQRTYSRITASAPGIPANLVATATGKGRIVLQWTDNSSDENGFYVERAPSVSGAPGTFAQVGQTVVNGNKYTDLTVSPSTAYFYRVRAFSDGGVSPYTNTATATTPATNPLPYRGDAYVLGHEDDWQIFAGDIAYSSLQNATTVLFVYVTAGEAGAPTGDPYMPAREAASMASIDAVIGTGAWTCASKTVSTHPILRCAKGSVVSYFMRLPDGNNIDGQGYGYGSITRLRDLATPLATRDGSTTYNTWADLQNTVSSIITTELSNQQAPYLHVYTHENDVTLDPGDHPDHNRTGDLVRGAAATHVWDVHQFIGYDTQNRPINVGDAPLAQKMVEFNAYNATMVALGYESTADYSVYFDWLKRDYLRTILPPSPSLTGPTHTAANAVSQTEIDVTWQDNSRDETGFFIERAPDANGAPGAWAQIDSVGTNVTTYANTGLAIGTTYWYRIRAVNLTGVSGYDDPISAVTLAPAPTVVPSGMAATAASATEIDVSWTFSPTGPMLGFRVERAPDAGGAPGTFAEIGTVGSTARTYADTTLNELTTYWYRVRGYNSGGTSDYSSPISANTLTGLPAPPSGLKVTPLSQTAVALDWKDNSNNELGFQIEQAPDLNGAPGTFQWIVGVAGNSVTWNINNLAPGTTYWFRIRSTYIDSSAYSNLASGSTLPPAPAAPSNVVATAPSGSEIDLSWTDVATNETGYTVQRAPDNAGVAGTYVTVATLGANATSYANVGLAANTRYWYHVRSSNAGGASAYVVTNTTTLAQAPLAPSGFSAKATTAATTATLTWTDNSIDETGFRIEVAPDAGGVAGTYTEIGTVAANVKTYTATGLTGATKYWFRVRSYSTYGNSGYTNESNMTTPLPTSLTVTTSTTTGTLTWTAGVGAKVDVWRDATKIKTGIANTGSTTDTGRTIGTTYAYKVCNTGFSDAANCSNTVSIKF
ncbi:MAG TPA: fibronectin type III domain-containing protein [Gemmatimonadaceae bacterium]|nr:fibronectin type III domain-containing protein [Gemmatimonadaceae bacterium]